MRSDNHHSFHVSWDCIEIEQVQFLKLDVFVFDKRFQHGDRAAAFRKRWFLVTGDITKGLLFPFDKIHHRTGDGLLAFECSHTRAFAERHSALVEIGHLGCLNCFVATIVIEHQKALVCDNLVLVE